MNERITVEVAYALPDKQKIVSLAVAPGTTARDAVRMAHLEQHFPALAADVFLEADLGIFGKSLRKPDEHALNAGDRVEVYRPLTTDPKLARKRRAEKAARASDTPDAPQ